MSRCCTLVPVGFLALAGLSAAPPLPEPAVAPPPREVENTWVYRAYFEQFAHPPDNGEVEKVCGVEWQINVGVRRLVSSGRDVIDFKWSIRYTGRRQPLVIRRPSLTRGFTGETTARIYAFPPGKDKGRAIRFTPPPEPDLLSKLMLDGHPDGWFLEVPKGETGTGTETVLVADLKEKLLRDYPGEFPAEKPPQLYAEFIHNAWDRGYLAIGVDAWTGELGRQTYLEVPELKTW